MGADLAALQAGARLLPVVVRPSFGWLTRLLAGLGQPAFEPAELLRQHVQDGFASYVAVILIREDYEPGRAARALDRLEQPLRLDREGARVGVPLTVDE